VSGDDRVWNLRDAISNAVASRHYHTMSNDPAQSATDPFAIGTSDQEADRRILLKASIGSVGLILTFYIVNALSVSTELGWSGANRPALYAWVLEGSAILAMLVSLPIALWLGHRFPIELGRLRSSIPIHIMGLLAYGSLQVALMYGSRDMLWPVLFDVEYSWGVQVFDNYVYEMRKQAMSYAAYQIILVNIRSLERAHLELRIARSEAKVSHRITLKCGGRLMLLAADDFVSAKSAGNYVEARFGNNDHLARMTLAQLETLLREASIPAIRVHRSWLLNRNLVSQIEPTGEGDVSITLTSGDTIPGSRRYRDRLDAV
jgi:hypothetical protein